MKTDKHIKYPAEYEEEILAVLPAYPELWDLHIHFIITDSAKVPYGTKPTLGSCFKPRKKRIYTVKLLNKAKPPLEEALFKNLTTEMRRGVIAHELMHVVQYNKCNSPKLLKTLASFAFSSKRRMLEREADKGAIEHGFGKELLAHALYIRMIPGYVEERPAINTDYLLPAEIKRCLRQPEQV